MVICIHF